MRLASYARGPRRSRGLILRVFFSVGSAFLIAGALSAPAIASFGLPTTDVQLTDSASNPVTQAGSHPFAFTTSIALNTVTDPVTGAPIPDDRLEAAPLAELTIEEQRRSER